MLNNVGKYMVKEFFLRWTYLLFVTLTCNLSIAEVSKNVVSNRDYLLGTGDLIRISVYGNPDMLTEARISAGGAITFPLVGEVAVAGLSPSQSEKKISELLEKGNFVKKAQVNLVVIQFQSQFVSVLGDVFKPGKYPLDRPSTLTDVLAMAGGPTPSGSDIVALIRNKDEKTSRQVFDMRDLVSKSDIANIPKVIGGDIIFVSGREVSVLGQVNRPGKYSVVNGVRTVLDFLSQAGGVSASGAENITVIINRNGKTEKHQIDVDQLYQTGDMTKNFELTGGDSIYVPRFPVFYIYGEVFRPGAYRLERNMNVTQALSSGGGLTSRGTERSIKIKRQVDGVLKAVSVNAGDFLKADDIIYVGESLF